MDIGNRGRDWTSSGFGVGGESEVNVEIGVVLVEQEDPGFGAAGRRPRRGGFAGAAIFRRLSQRPNCVIVQNEGQERRWMRRRGSFDWGWQMQFVFWECVDVDLSVMYRELEKLK